MDIKYLLKLYADSLKFAFKGELPQNSGVMYAQSMEYVGIKAKYCGSCATYMKNLNLQFQNKLIDAIVKHEDLTKYKDVLRFLTPDLFKSAHFKQDYFVNSIKIVNFYSLTDRIKFCDDQIKKCLIKKEQLAVEQYQNDKKVMCDYKNYLFSFAVNFDLDALSTEDEANTLKEDNAVLEDENNEETKPLKRGRKSKKENG